LSGNHSAKFNLEIHMNPSNPVNGASRKKLIAYIFVNLFIVSSFSLYAGNTWTGGSSTGNNWSDTANWGGAAPSYSSTLVFSGSTRLTPNNDTTGTTLSGTTAIQFASTAGAFTISGNAITLGGNIGFSANPASAITQTINLPMTLSANRTVTSQANGNITLGGVVSGASYNLITAGSGIVTLSANNTCGAVQINSGTLNLGLNNALPTTGTGLIIAGTGTETFDLKGNSQTLGGITFAGTGGASAVANISDSVGGGSLTLNGTLTQNSGGLGGTIAVPINLNGTTRTFNIQNSSYSVTMWV
jgi:hypothetical protein